MSIKKNGSEILTLEEWERFAGPKRPDQWVDGRSAKEVARAWLGAQKSELPEEVNETLLSNPAFARIQKWMAEPEAKLKFDSFPGEPRNSDLAVYAEDAFGPFLIAVEAKADEPFGETVADALAASVERCAEKGQSNGVVRIQQLVDALLGPRQNGEPPLKHLRYQLLTACAGALCKAECNGFDRAVLFIHEFVTSKTSDEKHEANATDLNNFLKRITHGKINSVVSGHLYGPFSVPGVPLLSSQVKLFVGKAMRNLRS